MKQLIEVEPCSTWLYLFSTWLYLFSTWLYLALPLLYLALPLLYLALPLLYLALPGSTWLYLFSSWLYLTLPLLYLCSTCLYLPLPLVYLYYRYSLCPDPPGREGLVDQTLLSSGSETSQSRGADVLARKVSWCGMYDGHQFSILGDGGIMQHPSLTDSSNELDTTYERFINTT